jgi:hypothetical protein
MARVTSLGLYMILIYSPDYSQGQNLMTIFGIGFRITGGLFLQLFSNVSRL